MTQSLKKQRNVPSPIVNCVEGLYSLSCACMNKSSLPTLTASLKVFSWYGLLKAVNPNTFHKCKTKEWPLISMIAVKVVLEERYQTPYVTSLQVAIGAWFCSANLIATLKSWPLGEARRKFIQSRFNGNTTFVFPNTSTTKPLNKWQI